MARFVSTASGRLLALLAFVVTIFAVEATGLGEPCQNASQCSVANALCINNKCACNATTDVLVGNKCILAVGARCFKRPCEAANSICSDNKFCVCIKDHQQTYNNSFCYKIPQTLNDYCEVDKDCAGLQGEAVCNGNKCVCKDNYAFHENSCKKKVGTLGGFCVPETQVCFLERNGDNQNVECMENICKCKEGFEPSKDFMSCGADTLGEAALAMVLMVVFTKILA